VINNYINYKKALPYEL